ncbi:MAG: beta-galactosidase [Kiritimatiellae bacterium]|nr:beta-galactosidase [Kiritimatiellia bacterium]
MRRLTVLTVFAAAAAGSAFGVLPCRFLHEMTGEYVTPHHSFRGSAAEKPLKVLFLLDRAGARDAVELVQRFSVEPTYFLMTYGDRIAQEDMYESAWAGTTVYEKTRELDEKLNAKYDLYVFGRKSFTSVNEEHRYRILKAVRDEGAGLLMVGDMSLPRMPYKKVCAEKLPAPKFAESFALEYKRASLAAYRLGKGRVVLASCGSPSPTMFFTLVPSFPIDDLWPAKYENAIAFAGAAMRYAAGRDEVPSQPARTRFRNRFNDEVPDTACAGTYYRDTIGANGAVVVERVETPSPVGGVTVDAPEVVKPGEAFSVKAEWKSPSAAVSSACVETLDSPKLRVMTRQTVAVPPGATSLSAEIADARIGTKAGYVRVTLLDAAGKPLEIAEKLQFFPRRELPDYMQMGWDTVMSMHPFAGAPVLVDRIGFEFGLTHPSSGGGNLRSMAVMNQSAVPYLTRIGIGAAENGSSKQNQWFFLDKAATERMKGIKGDLCFYRPEVKQLWADGIRHRMQNLPKYAPGFYNLGDENGLSVTAGFGEYDDKYFREFLKAKYGTIERLNRDWRTNCADFASVPHLKPEDAKRVGNLAAWGDHRAYIEKMYADIHAFCRDEIRKLDPGAPVGAEGSMPGDLELTFDKLEFWGPYSNLVEDEVLRSLGGDRIRMLWWGGYPASHGGRGKVPFPLSLMKDLATGTVMGNAWFDVRAGNNHGFFYSDLKVADDVAAYLPWHDRFKDGLAQLLIRNPLKDEGILLYWSHACRTASLASEKCLSPTDGLTTLIKSFYRTGRSFEFVSARTLGRLEKAKVVFLCGATALSDAEVAALRAFAERGGRIVADVEPAIMNENLAWRDKSALAGIWGKGGSTLLGKKLSLAAAHEKSPGAFDREIAAYLPPAVACTPAARMDENAIMRTRGGVGFDLVTAMWPATNLGAKIPVKLPGRRFLYDPMVGFVDETSTLALDFADTPFVSRTIFAAKQSAPEFAIEGAVRGGEVKVKPPAFVSGRVYNLTVRDAKGDIRWRFVFDRAENAPKKMYVAYTDAPGEWRATLVDCATGLKTEKTFRVTE